VLKNIAINFNFAFSTCNIKTKFEKHLVLVKEVQDIFTLYLKRIEYGDKRRKKSINYLTNT